jgi:hypothetical protein
LHQLPKAPTHQYAPECLPFAPYRNSECHSNHDIDSGTNHCHLGRSEPLGSTTLLGIRCRGLGCRVCVSSKSMCVECNCRSFGSFLLGFVVA